MLMWSLVIPLLSSVTQISIQSIVYWMYLYGERHDELSDIMFWIVTALYILSVGQYIVLVVCKLK